MSKKIPEGPADVGAVANQLYPHETAGGQTNYHFPDKRLQKRSHPARQGLHGRALSELKYNQNNIL